MGVRFDWEMEAEHIKQGAGADLNAQHARRRRVAVLFATVLLFIVLLGGAGVAVALRLNVVDSAIRDSLLATVEAEVTALRIGDPVAYIDLQRSASSDWTRYQSERFRRYQDLKAQAGIQLSGTVLDVQVDNQRGRVTLEEMLNGAPNSTVWFYWRYPDGWRHVPSDYTFWGEPATTGKTYVTTTYRAVDTGSANALSAKLDSWITVGCQALGCSARGTLPNLTLSIVPEPFIQMTWDAQDSSRIILPSPLAANERAARDQPLPQANEDTLAQMVAEWLFNHVSGNLQPLPTSDAAWLRSAIINWLASNFTGRPGTAPSQFIQSLYDGYGDTALTGLVQALSPSADVNVVGVVLGQPLEGLTLNWSGFFQWRLEVEKTLLARGDMTAFYALWDVGSPTSQTALQTRVRNPDQAVPQVRESVVGLDQTGATAAQVEVTIGDQPARIFFRLVNGSWKRSG